MKIKDGFVLKKVGDSAIVVAVGKRAKEFNGIISLNETAEFLWNNLEKAQNAEELSELLFAEYDVSKEKALDSCEKFIAKVREANIIDE